MNFNANQVKLAIGGGRPGIARSFMEPKSKKDSAFQAGGFNFSPRGNTATGGIQWHVAEQHPGIATSLITAKEDRKALAQGLAMQAKLGTSASSDQMRSLTAAAIRRATASGAAPVELTTEAAARHIQSSKGAAGYGNYYGAYGSYGY